MDKCAIDGCDYKPTHIVIASYDTGDRIRAFLCETHADLIGEETDIEVEELDEIKTKKEYQNFNST